MKTIKNNRGMTTVHLCKKSLFLLLFLAMAVTARAGTTLTYLDLVRRLTDLEELAVLPVPGEACAQWSSYDRASRYDEKTGKYLNWDANGDGSGIIREEDGRQLLAEMAGPGCIWRIWSAAPGPGHVKIYLDGAAEPAVDLPFTGYFNHQYAPFTYPSLVHLVAARQNNFFSLDYVKLLPVARAAGTSP